MSRLTEAIRKLQARVALTAEESELIDQELERREQWECGHEPRTLGKEENKRRSQEHKTLWLREARRILKDNPLWWRDLERVAVNVLNWCDCQKPAVRMKSKPYSVRTIYRHILKNQKQLSGQDSASHGNAVQRQEGLVKNERISEKSRTVQCVIQDQP